MHIFIEGVDGVGKTSVAKGLAKKLGFIFVERPFSECFNNKMVSYIEIKDELNRINSKNLSCWFYGLNYIYCVSKYKSDNIVCDRGLASNYAWKHDADNEFIIASVLKASKKPDITILLTLDKNVQLERLGNRVDGEKDLFKVGYSDRVNSVIRTMLEKNGIKYYEMDRTNDSINDTVEKISAIVEKEMKL